ncbi:3-hydroxyacyl-CoA dehydrogenase NAD-binding domain-containing protein [Maricaulis sp.]|uniref:3-hydroxyacyl-CoA dehydrogenase NAD-binding domain-containing protein n=1 Tax=Maricaulis sp. TaxID=1486257 RepID=UPI0026375705|nr:3-hydroxyacyl-CoA dehydrogenase NAD-binding domain-containing protein [Maricaulis sp.]
MLPVTTDLRDDCLVITVNHPPVNALSHAVRAGLVEALATARPGMRAAIIICAGRTFFSGADISEFGKPPRAPSLPDVLATIEDCPIPVIAAIHGQALGGGFEVALSCDFRVMEAKAKVGLPEVNLGLIPGAGGTQRTPRLGGLDIALQLALSGKPIPARLAVEKGLADMICQDDLLADALAFSHRGDLAKRRVRDMPAPDMDETVFERWKNHAAKRQRGQNAPQAILEAVEAATDLPFDEGLAKERELFSGLVGGAQSRAMRHLFFAERLSGKLANPVQAEPKPINSIGVVGAGTMGVGIAASALAGGYAVALFDANPDALANGRGRIEGIIKGDAKKGRISPAEADDRHKRLSVLEDWSGYSGCDLIIEAVFEDMDVKKEVLAKIDTVARPDALIASNTSYLDIDALAASISNPERVLGLHFFSPAHIMRLLEIVRGAQTSDEALMTALALAKRMRKVGVVSGVCHGFIGNRMLSGYGREAGLLLLEGASPEEIDKALLDFGMPMGPFAMGDMAGLDIGYMNRKKLDPALFEERASRVHDRLVEAGCKGQKTGSGFYTYDPETRAASPNPLADEIIDQVRAEAQVTPRSISAEEIVERCIFALINEGAQLLGEGIAQRGSDVDVVYANGYGFPRYRGGPFFYADEVGLDHVLARIKAFGQSDPRWWTPSPLLQTLADTGGRLSTYTPE